MPKKKAKRKVYFGKEVQDAIIRYNGSDNTYVYIAFAEHPFVTSKGSPTTAR